MKVLHFEAMADRNRELRHCCGVVVSASVQNLYKQHLCEDTGQQRPDCSVSSESSFVHCFSIKQPRTDRKTLHPRIHGGCDERRAIGTDMRFLVFYSDSC